MVVRRRARKILVPLLLYAVSAGVVGYFVHHAHSGARGLEAKQQFKIKAYEVNQELEAVKTERAEWERRIALLRSDQIDRDLTFQLTRFVLIQKK
jgi:cell division protein FtsB